MSNKYFLGFLTLLLSAGSVAANDITGDWSGLLKITPQNSLRLVFHFSKDAVTLDSPDQNAFGINGEVGILSSDSISFGVPALKMNYGGRLIGDSIVGEFRQGYFSTPLVLKQGVTKPNRPQTPIPPFPYTTEEVKVKTPDAILAGTLTIPEKADTSTTAVVLVSGSGLQNRDEEIFDHKPFAVLADYLGRNGIASLRYDDRGFGESEGENENATTVDFANDARAMVNWLRDSGRFSKIGLIGHSEGGMIAYMLGSEQEMLDFIVSIAGPSVSGAEINAYQNKMSLINSGVDSIVAAQFAEALQKANQYRLNNPPLKTVDKELLLEIYPQYEDSMLTRQLGGTITSTLTMETIHPWMEYFLKSEPSSDLENLKVPALIIYGEKDCQVPSSLNLEPAKSHAPKADVRCYPGLNHMMQHAKTGEVGEYREIEETVSPEVLEDIVEFVKRN